MDSLRIAWRSLSAACSRATALPLGALANSMRKNNEASKPHARKPSQEELLESIDKTPKAYVVISVKENYAEIERQLDDLDDLDVEVSKEISAQTTHLIFDQGDNELLKEAETNKQITIVTPLWVTECIKTQKIASPTRFKVVAKGYKRKREGTSQDEPETKKQKKHKDASALNDSQKGQAKAKATTNETPSNSEVNTAAKEITKKATSATHATVEPNANKPPNVKDTKSSGTPSTTPTKKKSKTNNTSSPPNNAKPSNNQLNNNGAKKPMDKQATRDTDKQAEPKDKPIQASLRADEQENQAEKDEVQQTEAKEPESDITTDTTAETNVAIANILLFSDEEIEKIAPQTLVELLHLANQLQQKVQQVREQLGKK